jgi:hypothetical protein
MRRRCVSPSRRESGAASAAQEAAQRQAHHEHSGLTQFEVFSWFHCLVDQVLRPLHASYPVAEIVLSP